MEEFLEFINDADVVNAGFEGSKFTWSKIVNDTTSKWARLDRVLINSKFGVCFLEMEVTHLPNTIWIIVYYC